MKENIQEDLSNFQDDANELMYDLSQEEIECNIIIEAQTVIDEAREIIKELLIK